MYAGSLAIIFIIILIVVIFLRAGKPEYAVSAAPLGIVPAAHLISYPVSLQLGKWFSPAPALFATVIDLGALVVSAILFGFLAVSFLHSKKSRRAYLICCGLYTVALTMVLISSLVTF